MSTGRGTLCWHQLPGVCAEHHCHLQLRASQHPKWVWSSLMGDRMALFLTYTLFWAHNIDCPAGACTSWDEKLQPVSCPSLGSVTLCGMGQETQFLRESCALPQLFSSQAPNSRANVYTNHCQGLPTGVVRPCPGISDLYSGHSRDSSHNPLWGCFFQEKKNLD